MSGLVERLRGWVAPLEAAADTPAPAETVDRREREPTPAERQIAEVIAQKLLHGWLQNRHQTLMPLSINLALLSPEDRGRIARFAALAATAGIDGGAPARLSAWLGAVGGGADTLAAFRAGPALPPAPRAAIADMAAPELASIAYVLALVAARDGAADDAGRAFAEYVGERLRLPSNARRSAQRRYGR